MDRVSEMDHQLVLSHLQMDLLWQMGRFWNHQSHSPWNTANAKICESDILANIFV